MSKLKISTSMLAPGVNYMTAYTRLQRGWDIERACTEPPRRWRPARTLAERQAWYQAKRDAAPKQPRKIRQRYTRQADDTSPAHIRTIRAALCDEFVKTGVLNTDLQRQLREYANECRATANDPKRVPDEPDAKRHRGRQARVADDSRAIHIQGDIG